MLDILNVWFRSFSRAEAKDRVAPLTSRPAAAELAAEFDEKLVRTVSEMATMKWQVGRRLAAPSYLPHGEMCVTQQDSRIKMHCSSTSAIFSYY